MEILGIGASELVFIVIIAIIILGPKDMQKAGKTIGRWLNQLIKSDGWKALQRASKEIRSMPTNLMREANLEEVQQMGREIRNSIDPRRQPPASSPSVSTDSAKEVNASSQTTATNPVPDNNTEPK